jgi:hypothetical protein
MSALLIQCGQEQGIPNPRPRQGSGTERSPAHSAERLGLGAKEIVVHRSLFPDFQSYSSSVEDQGVREDGILPLAALRHDSGQGRRRRSEGSTQIPLAQSAGGRSAAGDRKRERDTDRYSNAAYIYGAGASERLENPGNLPPKQYTKLWYCHINCRQPGPWRSEITRCLGCEHDRCELCEEETVVTRDPSAPRR